MNPNFSGLERINNLPEIRVKNVGIKVRLNGKRGTKKI